MLNNDKSNWKFIKTCIFLNKLVSNNIKEALSMLTNDKSDEKIIKTYILNKLISKIGLEFGLFAKRKERLSVSPTFLKIERKLALLISEENFNQTNFLPAIKFTFSSRETYS